MNDPLGEKDTLTVQTRNDAQVQHVYLRFPLTELRGRPSSAGRSGRTRPGPGGSKPASVATAELRLQILENESAGPATLHLYGLSEAISDVWPENRLVWANSLSAKSLSELPKLGETRISPQADALVISGKPLAEFVAQASHRSVTLILTGSSGNELITFASKERVGQNAPTLVLGLKK
jgi:hypothetical protein